MSRTPRKSEDGGPLDTIKNLNKHVAETPTPLRQAYTTKTTALKNKRTLAIKSTTPSSATKKKLNSKLIHGIMEAMPHLAPSSMSTRSPPSTLPRSSMSSAPPSTKLKDICFEEEDEASMTTPPYGKLKDIILDNSSNGMDDPSCSNSSFADDAISVAARKNHGCGNGRLINICFGAQGLTVEDSVSGHQTSKMFKQQGLGVS
jgi:hypothetical protein